MDVISCRPVNTDSYRSFDTTTLRNVGKCLKYSHVLKIMVDRVCIVDIKTRHGLDGPEIEARQCRGFSHRSRPTLGPTSLLYNGYRVSFPGVKRPGRGVDHALRLAPRLKKKQCFTFIPSLVLHGLFKVNFTCTLLKSLSTV